ncbi:PH domain-containing protein [Wenzhouxiangella sp. EGI_FJ10305]|uniref:PH domain-containing protein n=1 Tax=Wenzhouxiangella sp. EGI_FJ10305 TaxID=3243768 RepID=UPI0035E072EA
MQKIYKSHIDTWLLAALLAAMGLALLAALEVIVVADRSAWWIAPIAAVLGVGLPFWLLVDTKYRLDEKELRISSGPFRWRVLLSTIQSVEPSANPIASPALSLKRIRIDYGAGQTVYISPRDREAFIKELDRLRADAGRHE